MNQTEPDRWPGAPNTYPSDGFPLDGDLRQADIRQRVAYAASDGLAFSVVIVLLMIVLACCFGVGYVVGYVVGTGLHEAAEVLGPLQ